MLQDRTLSIVRCLKKYWDSPSSLEYFDRNTLIGILRIGALVGHHPFYGAISRFPPFCATWLN